MRNSKHGPRVAVAAVALVAGSAFAQSNVEMYGNADTAVSFDNSGKGQGTVNRVTSGILSGSRLGFRGSEDLGGGTKALVRLEMGVSLDTGTGKSLGDPGTATPAAPTGQTMNTTGGLAFNRRSYVGLSGALGTVTLGRDYTPIYYSGLRTDPGNYGLYGTLQGVIQLSGTGGEQFARASNAVFYTAPTFGGFRGRAMYSAGSETAGAAGTAPKSANTMFGLGGDYMVGRFSFFGAYQQLKMPHVASGAFTGINDTRKDMALGALYSTGRWSVSGGYLKITKDVANSDASNVYVGGTVKVGTGKVLAIYQKAKLQSVKGERQADVYGLAYVYPMSKRTRLYATWGQVRNNSIGTFALTAGDAAIAPSAAGENPRAIAFGMSHLF